ncbi:hypothetical protein [Sphingosinicella rhizophila]|uniref:Lipopolysaccharide assembly protein A domain-containing protein n=1 Tax=Sphingosinicella rhizophila TaxID=3050082 RepID=A0ABU3Q557_9SPHN|nr:hypothetical protein [Sphingosinicella sp. GR2756]MDT9598452.1 hypothetical protein [Sphingosinicella sp. GR2756]
MTAFTIDQWIVLALVFLLGLVLGMIFMAGGKWKRRYRDEVHRREELEAENRRLQAEAQEIASLRNAATRSGHRPDSERGPL